MKNQYSPKNFTLLVKFAYLYPAMQRANQASGRPIRKVSDKGVIIFMDSRFKKRLGWISNWVRIGKSTLRNYTYLSSSNDCLPDGIHQ